MTKEKIVWRLKTQPTPENLRELVKDNILTQEEARQILFTLESETDMEDLKSEIKFLRELVQKLSTRSTIVETIREVYKPYYNYGWYQPYQVWCSNTASGSIVGDGTTTINTANAVYTDTAGSLADYNSGTGSTSGSFSEIKTF